MARMNLLTTDIKKKFERFPLYSQDGKGTKAKVIVKYFTPDAQATWLITEGNITNDDVEMFGYVTLNGRDWEWGYVNLSQIKAVRGCFGLPVERDLYFSGTVADGINE